MTWKRFRCAARGKNTATTSSTNIGRFILIEKKEKFQNNKNYLFLAFKRFQVCILRRNSKIIFILNSYIFSINLIVCRLKILLYFCDYFFKYYLKKNTFWL